MQKLKTLLGYLAALLTIVIVFATFVGLDDWGNGLVALTGWKISPWFSGGDIDRSISRGNYRMVLYKPVFMGLVGETSSGFVQVKWAPFSVLPKMVDDEVDYDSDGRNDFRVRLDTVTGQARVYSENSDVLGLRWVTKLKDGWIVRINLRNKGKGK